MTKASKNAKYVSKVPGVSFRDDGKPRWVVRLRYRMGGKAYKITGSYPVDLSITDPTHVMHVRKARLDAEAYASQERASVRAHGKVFTDMAEAWTVGSVLEKVVEEIDDGKHAKMASVRTMRNNLTTLLGQAKKGNNMKGFPVLMQMRLNAITYEDFHGNKPHSISEGLKSRNGEPAHPSSLKKMLRAVQFAFKRAQAWGVEFQNPIEKLKKLTVKDERDRVLSDDEWRLIMAELKNTSDATQAAIQFARYTAVRRSEAIKLDWKDVDFKNKIAHLRGTKSHDGSYNERIIPLPKEAMVILEHLFQTTKNKSGAVFAHQHGKEWKRIGIDTTTQAWTRARERVAQKTQDTTILTARVHDLRHTRITEIGQILTIAEAARVSGHKDLRTFMRYFNPDPKSIGAKLDAYEQTKVIDGTVEQAVQALVALNDDDMVVAFQMAIRQKGQKLAS